MSGGYDATIRLWPLKGSESSRVTTLPLPVTAVVVAADGEIVAAAADGQLHFFSAIGDERDYVEASPTPITALALSRTGEHLAAAGVVRPVVIVSAAPVEGLQVQVMREEAEPGAEPPAPGSPQGA